MKISTNENDDIPTGYNRVTEILEFYTNFSGIDPLTLANAADRGSRVHKYCEMYALNLFLSDIDEDCKNYFNSFKEWYDSFVVKLLYNELRINSEKYLLTGKFDLIVQLKGDPEDCLTLIDIKTPASSSLTWPLQMAAYSMLLREEKKVLVSRRIVLMLPKHGEKAKIIEYQDHDLHEKLYISALTLFRFFK